MILPPKRPRLRRPRLHRGTGTPEPDTVRAFLAAPLVPAACAGLLAAAAGGPAFGSLAFAYAATTGCMAAVLIGLPLYLVLPEQLRRSTTAMALAGGAVAALVPVLAGALAWACGVFLLGAIGGGVFALIRNAPLPPP